jgi:hypothetical protein
LLTDFLGAGHCTIPKRAHGLTLILGCRQCRTENVTSGHRECAECKGLLTHESIQLRVHTASLASG